MQKKLLIVIFLFISFPAFAQFSIHRTVVAPRLADSVDIAFYGKKRGLMAATQTQSLNMALWAFDRYVQKAPYAYIDIHSTKKNLRKGFVWDNDQMGNNMFLHPYHGNLYYNSARSNGFNFWESGAFSLTGSFVWEMFLENEYPSLNDIIATPVGGLALGEMFYRTSDLVLDDRMVGGNRFGRELAGFLIAPTRGLTRILNGDAWRKRPTSGKQFGVPDVSVEVSSGIWVLELKDEIFDSGGGLVTDINVEYGDRFSTDNTKPYDYFTFKANMNTQGTQPLLGQINVTGRLFVTELVDNEKDFLSLGFYQHFDYYDSDTISSISARIPYRIAAPASAGVGLIYQSKRTKDWIFDAFAHANIIMLGGVLSDHYVVDKRDYNLGSGFGTKSGLNLAWKDKIGISATHEMYRMYSWKGYPQDVDWDNINVHEFNYQGDRSQATLHVSSLRVDYKLLNHIYLSGVYYNYTRDTNYKYYDNVFTNTSEGRLMLTYKF